MPEPTTPREVFAALLCGITERRFTEMPDLYADDCVVEVPYAIPEPVRFEGLDMIRAYFAGTGDRLQAAVVAEQVVVHESTDPEVVIGEWVYRYVYGARTATSRHIQILRVRDGKIVWSRDFHNPADVPDWVAVSIR
jgi:uncharacterized protein